VGTSSNESPGKSLEEKPGKKNKKRLGGSKKLQEKGFGRGGQTGEARSCVGATGGNRGKYGSIHLRIEGRKSIKKKFVKVNLTVKLRRTCSWGGVGKWIEGGRGGFMAELLGGKEKRGVWTRVSRMKEKSKDGG